MFQEEDRASPLAFTVDFGGHHSVEGKQKKLERFALRSSQRKQGSPKGNTKNRNEDDKQMKTKAKAKTVGEPGRADSNLVQARPTPALRQNTGLVRKRDSSRQHSTAGIWQGEEVTKFSTEILEDNQGGDPDRLDVTAALIFNNTGVLQDMNEDDYCDDTFDRDSDDKEDKVNDKPDSDPSETGTYTVDKDEETQGCQVSCI